MDDDFVFWSDFGERSLCQNRIGLPEGQNLKSYQEKTILQICLNAGQLRTFGQY